MADWFYWVTMVVLVFAWGLPRRHLHLVGILGMSIMSWRAWTFGPDWPMVVLNASTVVAHTIMSFRIWVLRKEPG